MATKIRGITIQLDGDTSGLTKSLQGANKEIKSTQNQLKDVEKLLKLDPKNTELLRQKQELLGHAIGETKGKLETLKQAEAQMKTEGVDKNSEAFMALQREIAETETNLKNLEKEAKNTTSAFDKIGEASKKVADGAQKIADKTKAVSAAGAAVAASLIGMGMGAISAADDLATLSARTGISTDTLQKFKFAEDMVDVSTEELAGAFSKMKINMEKNPEAFDALGVAVKDADGNFRDLESVFYDSVAALAQIEDGTQRDLTAMDLFGKGADTLATIIDDGGEGLKAYGEKAEEMGLILSEDTIGKLTATGDQIDTLKATALATMAETGAKLIEELKPTIETIIGKIEEVVAWVGNLDGDTLNLIVTIGLAIAAISPIAKIVSGISTAIGGVSKAIQFLLANPMVALVAAVVGFVTLIATKGDQIQQILQKVDNFLQNIFAKDWSEQFGILGQVLNFFASIFGGVWDGVKATFNGVIDFIRGVFTGDWQRALNGLGNIFSGVFQGIKSVLERLSAWLDNVFKRDWTKTFGAIGNIVQGVIKNIKNIIDGLKSTMNGIVNFIKSIFKGDWKGAWDGIKQVFSGIWETFGAIAKAPINVIIGLLNGLIDGINWCIRGINKLSFEIPSWVPLIGGNKVGFNIGEIGKLAYLAQGGVLQAGNAIVGENGPELLTMSPQGAVVQPLTNNNTTNQNYGGVTINVYGAPGQNIQQLAELVSEEIGNATRRQEAVFA